MLIKIKSSWINISKTHKRFLRSNQKFIQQFVVLIVYDRLQIYIFRWWSPLDLKKQSRNKTHIRLDAEHFPNNNND